MTALLERKRADVIVAESGADALAALERIPDIDIVLMDIMMPVMDGYETIRAIRAIDRFKSLPIIAVTGKAGAGERQRCIDAGANDYIPKPVESVELLEALKPWLPTTVPPTCMNTSARPAAPPLDGMLDGAAGPLVPILVVDDDPAKRLALRAVLSPLGYSIVEADSGLAALRCVLAQDFAVILLDVRMPIMDGIETAMLIRQRHQSEMTPIIFITAHVNDELADTDRYAQGAVDFIFAPVPPDELRAKVSVFANLFIKAEELATQAREAEDVRRPAAAPHRGRAHRHLPDRHPEPVRLHQSALDRDHRHPGRGGAGQEWDTIIGARRHAPASSPSFPTMPCTGRSSAIGSRSGSRVRPHGSRS